MKQLLRTQILFVLSLSANFAHAAELSKEFDTLGENKAVVEKIKSMDSQQKIRVVQNRYVDRNNRLELGISGAYNSGGDSYVQTNNLGGLVQYHFTPRWSLGVQFQKAYNPYTNEGRNVIDKNYQALRDNPGGGIKYPAIDYPLQSTLATLNFYPIYGKMNLFDSGIAQFDLYFNLGAGKIQLSSGESDLYSFGAGAGIWLTQYLTTRLEFRFQKYEDLLNYSPRTQNQFQALASLGVMIW